MKSPFPGMDPYLEAHWGDVHQSLVTYARDQLQAGLPADLRARVEERVYVESDDGEARNLYPDVYIASRVKVARGKRKASGGLHTAEPLLVEIPEQVITEAYIQIVEPASGYRVVTVIEFLSPSNKIPGAGQELYLQKQRDVREARASLVEVDLTRKGKRILLVRPEAIPESHRTTFQVCVNRGWKPTRAEIYRVSLQEPLPAIAVPLRETDEDVPLDLQALIEEAYEKGRYDDLDYSRQPEPPLCGDDAAWSDEWLRGKGLRKGTHSGA